MVAAGPGARRCLLVLDDDPGVVASYRQYLAPPADTGSALDRLRKLTAVAAAAPRGVLHDGWTLVTASSGEEALALGAAMKARGDELCVGFFDVKMPPGIDGVETLLQLRTLFPRMRFGIVSAYNDRPIDQINAMFDPEHRDHWDFMSKPFTEAEIRQKARMLVATWLQAEAEANARAELAYLNANLTAVVEQRTKELEQSRAKLELGERLVAMGTLAAGIGHEVNNPLTYVVANLEALAGEVTAWRGIVPDDQLSSVRQMIAECSDGAERIRKIISNLSVLSRRGEVRNTTVDLRNGLERAIAITYNQIKHRARLVRRYGAAPWVVADEARIVQVFVNLLANAAQAIAVGERDAHEIRVELGTDARGHAVVEIADTGAGIPDAIRARIFDPFFTARSSGGTGLGLSISHGIVTEVGGTIDVESTEGAGTVFRIVLPAAEARGAPAIEAVSVEAGRVRRGRVLAIDDEPAIGRAIRMMLSAQHDVVVAHSGREGLALIDDGHRFDVIVCDLMMPEVTGMEVHAVLSKRDPPLADRMVFLTGGAFTSAAQEFLGRFPNRWLAKPFDRRRLADVLDELGRLASPAR